MPRKENYHATEAQLTNRFINYYTLKWLWLKHKNPVNDLYKVLPFFNRSLYDRILRLDEFDIEPKVVGLEKVTGIPKDYLLGNKYVSIPGVLHEDWIKFIQYRKMPRETKKRKDTNNEPPKETPESKIRMRLEHAYSNIENKSTVFNDVNYFACYRRPRDKNIEADRINQITNLIGQFKKVGLDKVEVKELSNYEETLRAHLEVVHATLVLKKFLLSIEK